MGLGCSGTLHLWASMDSKTCKCGYIKIGEGEKIPAFVGRITNYKINQLSE